MIANFDGTISSVYYGFYCDPELQKLYWSVVSSAFFYYPSLLLSSRGKDREANMGRMAYAAVTGFRNSLCLCYRHSQRIDTYGRFVECIRLSACAN